MVDREELTRLRDGLFDTAEIILKDNRKYIALKNCAAERGYRYLVNTSTKLDVTDNEILLKKDFYKNCIENSGYCYDPIELSLTEIKGIKFDQLLFREFKNADNEKLQLQ